MKNLSYRKAVIVGCGFVGSASAFALMQSGLFTEMVLIDANRTKAEGEALDISHGLPFAKPMKIWAGDYDDVGDAGIIIVTAGAGQKPGETRLDLVKKNVAIFKSIIPEIAKRNRDAIMLIVANPVDILTYKCTELMGLPDGRVFGTGNILDTSRLVRLVADYTGLNTEMIRANIVGEHGDGQIPIWSMLSIAGVPIKEYCADVGLQWNARIRIEMEEKVRGLGAEIIAGKGKTHYGIATCVCYIADAILNQRLTIAPVTSVLHGEYGLYGVSLSVPSIIGVNGIERRLEEPWSDFEVERFNESARNLKSFLQSL